jgi:glycosyltransferase involved in cell wall biosynthesis
MPSPNETFGRTPREAMSQSTLVLASDCYGHRLSVINNINGYLYKKNNIEDLKNKIIFIMNCKRNKKIIKNANIFLKKKLIEKPLIIKKLLDIYK